MSISSPKDYLVNLILEDRTEEAITLAVLESEEHDVARKINDTSLMSYLLKMEEYLDNHSIYAFDGWEKAEFVKKPKVEKFRVTFYMHLGPKGEIEGLRRITNTKEAQNRVRYEKLQDGSFYVEIEVLKRYLDAIETQNKQKSDELSDEELGRV